MRSLLVLLAFAAGLQAADWPTYKADPARSSVSPDALTFPLRLAWSYRPAQSPDPAWPEPGKELNRVDFDYAFQPVAAGGVVYFGSSADDAVRAVDLRTGKLLWRFLTGGPVRFAPTVARGKVYVTSDDGCLYCLDARSGRLVWKFQAGPAPDRILANGRLAARYPCRTDALVVGRVAYVTAGMWPTEGVYVYALDADTGKMFWRNDSSGSIYTDLPHALANGFSGVAPQGYLLVGQGKLIVPTGRSVPAAFDARTGRLLYYKPEKTHYHMAQYGGGYWCTSAGALYFNPKNRFFNPSHAHVGEAEPCSQDGMIAYEFETGDKVFYFRDKYRVLAADGVLYAAGGGSLAAFDLAALAKTRGPVRRRPKWEAKLAGRVYFLAKAANALLVGVRGGVRAFDPATGRSVWSLESNDQRVRGLAIADGRLLAATQRGEVLCFAAAASQPARIVETPQTETDATTAARADDILRRGGKTEGYALVVGEPDARLAAALAARSKLRIVAALPAAAAARARDALFDAGLLGARVEVHAFDDPARSHLPSYFADLVVVSRAAAALSPKECYRSLHPCGGALLLLGCSPAQAAAFAKAAGVPPGEFNPESRKIVRGKLPGAGEWRYPWADGGRTGVGAESRVRFPVQVLWFGGPGPGRLMDRHLMVSPPVSTNGRVFLQGENDVIAFDAYTGRELWSRHLPGVGRKYAQFYSSSLVADDDSVYVVVRDQCLRLDQATGAVRRTYDIPAQVEKAVRPPAPPKFLDVEWPTRWRVFGPFPKGKPPLPAETFRQLPEKVKAGDKEIAGVDVDARNGLIDFTALFGGFGLKPLPPDAKPPARPRRGRRFSFADLGRLCYACARIRCPKAGKLLIGAGADWGMEWYLDGKLVFSALRNNSDARRRGFFDRRPCSPTDRLFDVDVTAGEHVLAVMVAAGSRGWALTSASMAARAQELLPVPTGENPNVPNLKNLVWGYLSVTDDLLLGGYNTPVAPGLPAEWDLLARSESKAVFALDKQTGALRWMRRAPKDRVVANIEIAWGDGRLFLIEGTSKAYLVRERRRRRRVKADLTLVALRLADGRELWRQDDVPVLGDRYALSRLKSNITHLFMGLPNWGHLVYANGVVLYGVNAAYDAAAGKKLWRRNGRPGKLPIVYGDRIITAGSALDLRTGKPVRTVDPLTGRSAPWRYVRTYGCGPTAGCRNLLFFRAGADGFYDMLAGGSTNFGGVRPGCARTLLAANGLLLHPQGYSGCPCCYNFKTNIGFVSAPPTREVWYVFPCLASRGPVKSLRVNFGAPGDRKTSKGDAWLGYPRPMARSARPAPVSVSMPDAACFYRREAVVQGAEARWIYSSGLTGSGSIHIGLAIRPGLPVPALETAPTIDGDVSDPCWRRAARWPFQNTPFTMAGAGIDFRAFRTRDHFYFMFRRRLSTSELRAVPQEDAVRRDELDLFLVDRPRRRGIRFILRRDGHSSARFGTVGVSRKVDPSWKGEWRCQIRNAEGEWRAELAVPLKTLTASGLRLNRLLVNAMSLNLTAAGMHGLFLVDPYYGVRFRSCSAFLPIEPPPRRPPERTFTVRLHFAEIDPAAAPRRVFDVRLQGETVLKDFNIHAAAGGIYKPAVKTFRGVRASDEILVELKPPRSAPASAPPVLCGLEVLEQATKTSR